MRREGEHVRFCPECGQTRIGLEDETLGPSGASVCPAGCRTRPVPEGGRTWPGMPRLVALRWKPKQPTRADVVRVCPGCGRPSYGFGVGPENEGLGFLCRDCPGLVETIVVPYDELPDHGPPFPEFIDDAAA